MITIDNVVKDELGNEYIIRYNKNGKLIRIPYDKKEFNKILQKQIFTKLIESGAINKKEVDEIIEKEYINTFGFRIECYNEDIKNNNESDYKYVELNKYENSSIADSYNYIITNEDFKNMIYKYPSVILQKLPKDSFGRLLEKWLHGANENGYGKDNISKNNGFENSRLEWDNKTKFSYFIDNNKEMQYDSKKELYRGVRSSNKDLNETLKCYKENKPINMVGPSSWAYDKTTAKSFCEYSLLGRNNSNYIVFIDQTEGKRRAMLYPFSCQNEVLYSGNVEFDIINVEKSAFFDENIKGIYSEHKNEAYYIYVKEHKND